MTRITARTAWPWFVLALAVAIVALSFVPAWLTHHREMRGEGYRTLVLGLTAWQLGAVPVISGGVAAAAAAGLLAIGPARLRAWAAVAAALAFGLFAAAAFPIAHVGQVSSLAIGPGWTLGVALAAAAGMAGLTIAGARRRTRLLAALPLVSALAAGGGFVARVTALEAAEADRPHWSTGAYAKEGVRLELDEGAYRVGDRWSGTFSSSGLTVVLTEDPACPEARGAYRIFDAGDDAIRWNLIVDPCAEGARGAALEGVWERLP